MTVSDLVAFLRARVDEDAVAATMREAHKLDCEQVPNPAGYTYPCDCGVPERMLREVEAKRKILDGFDPIEHPVGPLLALAAVYCDHPDYDPAWT